MHLLECMALIYAVWIAYSAGVAVGENRGYTRGVENERSWSDSWKLGGVNYDVPSGAAHGDSANAAS